MKLFSLLVPLAVMFALVAQICAADDAALKANRAALKELKGTIRAKRNILLALPDSNILQNLLIEVTGILSRLSESANIVAGLKEQLTSAVGDAKATAEGNLQTTMASSNTLVTQLFGKLNELVKTAIQTINTLSNLSDDTKKLLNDQLRNVSFNSPVMLDGTALDLSNKIPVLYRVQDAVLALAKNIYDAFTKVVDTLKMLAAGGQTDTIVTNLQQQLYNLTSLSTQLNTLVDLANKIVSVAANLEDPQLAGLITQLEKLLDTNTKDISSAANTVPISTAGNLVPAVGAVVDQNTNLGVLNG